MASAAVAAFKSELTAMQRLLTQQRDILAAEDLARLFTLQGSAFVTRAERLTDLAIEDVSELTTLVQQGPWPASQQNAIIMALATSLHEPRNAAKERRCQQELWHFQNYTITEEKRVLCDPKLSMTIKIEKGLDVLERIGAVLLKEVCKKHVLGVICAAHQVAKQGQITEGTHLMQAMGMQETATADCEQTEWSAHDLRSWLVYFKGQYTTRFKNKRADAAIGHIARYPERPSAIDQMFPYSAMYGSAEVTPLPITADALTRITENVWCRRHAQALRDTPVQARTMQVQNPSNQMAPMVQMMQMMMTAMQGMTGMQNSPNIELTTPQRQTRPRPGLGVRTTSRNFPAIEDTHVQGENSTVEQSASLHAGPELPPAATVNTSPATTASSMSPQEQADKLIKAMQDGASDDDGDGDDDKNAADADPADGTTKGSGKKDKAKAKAKPKAKPKAVAKNAAKKQSKIAVKKAVTKGEHLFNPKYELEASRDQYLFRPGLPVSIGGESTKCFKFDIHGGKKGAEKAAKAYFNRFKATHSCQ